MVIGARQGRRGRLRRANLAKMPHLLVAGSTGSGKSSFINSMLISLLHPLPTRKSEDGPDRPEAVELSPYEGIPHLITPIITQPQEGGRRAGVAGRGDGQRYEDLQASRRAPHRRLQRPGRSRRDPPVGSQRILPALPYRSSSSTSWPT